MIILSLCASYFIFSHFLLSWQMGLGIRALTASHLPPTNFILVTLGSTAVLLIGCRTLLYQILPRDKSKKDDMYKRGSPFELFEVSDANTT